MGLVKEGSGSERQKYKSESAKIFFQRAKNQCAQNTKALKNYSPVLSALLTTQIKSNGESRAITVIFLALSSFRRSGNI